jgi:hypothetical protein
MWLFTLKEESIPTCIVLVALSLGGMEGRAALLLRRIAFARPARGAGDVSPWLVLGAWLANVSWAFRSWPWYWVTSIVLAIALATGALVTHRSVGLWLTLRPLVAVATAASAGLLWAVYPPAV